MGAKRGPKKLDRLTLSASRGKSKALPSFPPQLAAVAQDACKALGVLFGSLDIIVSRGVPYVVEVNEAPCFKIFQRRTKLKPAEFLLDYMLQAYRMRG